MVSNTTNSPILFRQRVEVFLFLLLIWLLLNASVSLETIAVGGVVSFGISLFSAKEMTFLSGFNYTSKAFVALAQYLVFFGKELLWANFRLAKIVLSPSLPIKPGFVKVRTNLKTKMGRLLLANSITLTPGTLSIEMEGEWLYVHWVDVVEQDIDGATKQIVSGFERYLEVMYG